jgi:transcriptional regulator with GAF, ATPase, and Fis domain
METKRFRRLGDVHDRTVDIRLISATHRDLPEFVRQQRFREDLYFRINIIPIRIPPLRERLEDVPKLAREILRRIAAERDGGNWVGRYCDEIARELSVARKHPGDAECAGGRVTRAARYADGARSGIATSRQ